LIDNLKFAAVELKKAGIRLLIEAVNTYDMPGFYIGRTQQPVDLIEETGLDNIFVQYDVYHMQRMEGELTGTIKKYFPRISHIQIADNSGRNEPGTGEIRRAQE
jgi:hydroxypyruvate isomerase